MVSIRDINGHNEKFWATKSHGIGWLKDVHLAPRHRESTCLGGAHPFFNIDQTPKEKCAQDYAILIRGCTIYTWWVKQVPSREECESRHVDLIGHQPLCSSTPRPSKVHPCELPRASELIYSQSVYDRAWPKWDVPQRVPTVENFESGHSSSSSSSSGCT